MGSIPTPKGYNIAVTGASEPKAVTLIRTSADVGWGQ
jgi:hypothetical protein